MYICSPYKATILHFMSEEGLSGYMSRESAGRYIARIIGCNTRAVELCIGRHEAREFDLMLKIIYKTSVEAATREGSGEKLRNRETEI